MYIKICAWWQQQQQQWVERQGGEKIVAHKMIEDEKVFPSFRYLTRHKHTLLLSLVLSLHEFIMKWTTKGQSFCSSLCDFFPFFHRYTVCHEKKVELSSIALLSIISPHLSPFCGCCDWREKMRLNFFLVEKKTSWNYWICGISCWCFKVIDWLLMKICRDWKKI